HQFQEGGLNAATAYVAPAYIGTRRDLVDFVDIDDAILGKLNVPIGLLHQISNKIFNISTYIAGFAEFRCVRLYERNTNQIRDMFDQISFADPGRSEQQNISFAVFNLPGSFG